MHVGKTRLVTYNALIAKVFSNSNNGMVRNAMLRSSFFVLRVWILWILDRMLNVKKSKEFHRIFTGCCVTPTNVTPV